MTWVLLWLTRYMADLSAKIHEGMFCRMDAKRCVGRHKMQVLLASLHLIRSSYHNIGCLVEAANDDDHNGNGVKRQPSHCATNSVLLRLQKMAVFFFSVVLRNVTGADDIEKLCVGFEGHHGLPRDAQTLRGVGPARCDRRHKNAGCLRKLGSALLSCRCCIEACLVSGAQRTRSGHRAASDIAVAVVAEPGGAAGPPFRHDHRFLDGIEKLP